MKAVLEPTLKKCTPNGKLSYCTIRLFICGPFNIFIRCVFSILYIHVYFQDNSKLPFPKYTQFFKFSKMIENNLNYKKMEILYTLCVTTKCMTLDSISSSNIIKYLRVSFYLVSSCLIKMF